MANFSTFSKEVEIELNGVTHKYKLVPLTGEHLPKIYELSKKLEALQGMKEEEFVGAMLDPEVADLGHYVVFETLKASYPNEDKNQLDRFASQKLHQFLGPVIELHFPQN
jgi:hypothetical protein